jgi:leucyl-tRNA synthetase
MEYNFSNIEPKIRQYWKDKEVYKVLNQSDKQKFYVLDMFPYPSGAGLHVGHPLGYIASDIFARYKKNKGFNVLHPMGFDAFGLPAEQYALETGQHPAVTTEKNINRYKEQLDNIGFCFDWSREVNTSTPQYYKWTQWIFLQLFKSWYNPTTQKAEYIDTLIQILATEGNANYPAPGDANLKVSAAEWNAMDEAAQRAVLMQYRIAYLDYAQVWWCEALGTVLANDEVVNGVSERGGHPVERKNMRQWFLRITAYADRMLDSLNNLDWSEAMKEMQRNWIGKSEGASVIFDVKDSDAKIEVFTTRPDTIFGVDFMVLAPEHELIASITTLEQLAEVEKYQAYVKSRSERERMAEKKISGCFTGAYAVHPFSGKEIPVYISEYVLAGYGTGAIMAVPAGDDRDHNFAKHFNVEITNIFGDKYDGENACTSKDVVIENSDFVSGKKVKEAAAEVLNKLEEKGIGTRKVNFKLRDAGFSRQRYWGEPFPIVYKGDTPYAIDEPQAALPEAMQQLPVQLPHVDSYKPGPNGEGPLANIESYLWVENTNGEKLRRETNTMPGYAGSSWYFLRYMDPNNADTFADKNVTDYWNQVDLYVGGTEHAVGHLLYARLWTKVLHDLGYLSFDEPFKKLLNQGMIQGSSRFIYRLGLYKNFKIGQKQIPYNSDIYISLKDMEEFEKGRKLDFNENDSSLWDKWKSEIYEKKIKQHLPKSVDGEYYNLSGDLYPIHVNIKHVDGVELNIESLKADSEFGKYFENAIFIHEEDGKFICGSETEKMSKSKYNVVNPDDIVKQYGADTFRMYEMFLGPIELSKPWDTKGIEGVHKFIKRFWRLFMDEQKGLIVNDEAPTEAELKVLHRTIKKVEDNTERFSFNTSVSQFMICVNELMDLKCNKRAILEPLVVLIAAYAPHMAEELWQQLGNESSVVDAPYPTWEEKYTVDNTKVYPVAINGKTRAEMEFALDAAQVDIEAAVFANEKIQGYLEGKTPKKIIFVKGKMINIVL